MKTISTKSRFAALSLLACYTLSFLILSASVPPLNPTVMAEGENDLRLMGERCNKISNDGQRWRDCEAYQAVLSGEGSIGCSGEMFVQKSDPNGAGAKLNEWYVDADKYANCYSKAKSKLAELSSNKCASLRKDAGNWDDCENLQNTLKIGLGCSGNMFIETARNNYYNPSSDRLEDCKKRIEAAGSVKVLKPDGSRAKAPNEGGAAAAVGNDSKEEEKPDCDATGAILSWIVCPVIDMGINFTDFVYSDFVQPMLANVPISTEPDDGGYRAWQQFRLLANILLIGTMLMVVYSQTKGGGGR